MATATEKQIRYAFVLLKKNGFDTRYMDASYKRLGAKMNERTGTVENWLKSLDIARMSELIGMLKGE